jgi:hypothetical protein
MRVRNPWEQALSVFHSLELFSVVYDHNRTSPVTSHDASIIRPVRVCIDADCSRCNNNLHRWYLHFEGVARLDDDEDDDVDDGEEELETFVGEEAAIDDLEEDRVWSGRRRSVRPQDGRAPATGGSRNGPGCGNRRDGTECPCCTTQLVTDSRRESSGSLLVDIAARVGPAEIKDPPPLTQWRRRRQGSASVRAPGPPPSPSTQGPPTRDPSSSFGARSLGSLADHQATRRTVAGGGPGANRPTGSWPFTWRRG